MYSSNGKHNDSEAYQCIHALFTFLALAICTMNYSTNEAQDKLHCRNEHDQHECLKDSGQSKVNCIAHTASRIFSAAD